MSGTSVPARIRRSVDFPDPFGPISPMRSRSDTVNETSRKSGCAPKDFEISFTLMIGDKAAVSCWLDQCSRLIAVMQYGLYQGMPLGMPYVRESRRPLGPA